MLIEFSPGSLSTCDSFPDGPGDLLQIYCNWRQAWQPVQIRQWDSPVGPSMLPLCTEPASPRPSTLPYGLRHTRLPWPSLSPGACSNSCPLSWWCWLKIQPSHPLLPPSPSALNLSQRQGLSPWISFSHQVAKLLDLPEGIMLWYIYFFYLKQSGFRKFVVIFTGLLKLII